LAVIDAQYPQAAGTEADQRGVPAFADARQRVVRHSGTSEVVLAVDLVTLVRAARWTDGVIEFVPQVGDFVATGEPLFVLYGGATGVRDKLLRTTVAFGPERTMEQDPMFSFRILVDIALKALSPAINDPTTAVLAIDQVHRLLRVVGGRHLGGEAIFDAAGRLRVINRTPNWENFVQVSCHEIRANGAGQMQSRVGCGRCSTISLWRCRRTDRPPSTTNADGWIRRLPQATRYRPTWRWRVSPTRKAWVERVLTSRIRSEDAHAGVAFIRDTS
jgi:uncharacterized membrane protein